MPGLRLKPSDVFVEDEIGRFFFFFFLILVDFLWCIPVSAPPHNSEMTDGCGLINKSALLSLRMKYDWTTFPTAIQMRYDGAKVYSDATICLLWLIFLTRVFSV